MAYLNKTNESDYQNFIYESLCKNYYYYEIPKELIIKLNIIIEKFYLLLRELIKSELLKNKPDIFGMSLYSGTVPASLFSLKMAKEILPNIKTIVGGPAFSQDLIVNSDNFNLFVEKTPFIDKIFIGEGENILLKYLQGKLPENQKIIQLSDIQNELVDINNNISPDFSDFKIESYQSVASYTSRSCIYQCSFCSETINWGKYRKRKTDLILKEMLHLYDKYNKSLFIMTDSLLNPVIDDFSKAIIKSNYNFYFDGYLKVDKSTCDAKNVALWRAGGFYRARLGIESGSQMLLDLMNKKITVDQIRMTIRNLANEGIRTTTYWIIGHPGESEADFKQTLDLIEELGDDLYEVESNVFQYFKSGQVNSDYWGVRHNINLLYSEASNNLLQYAKYVLDCEPNREETFSRMRRFVNHCKNLNIPNPYSAKEVYEANIRWLNKHSNGIYLP
jgi:radical SAM superfamily enzyme YgiQ (UPF0313 family)